jgi:hypothetical protein
MYFPHQLHDATGASRGPTVMRRSRVDSDIPRLMVLRTLGAVERTRHESRGRNRGALCPACPERAAQKNLEPYFFSLFSLQCSTS